MNTIDIENIELELFLEAIYKRYGYDFRQYSQATMKRRVQNLLSTFKFNKVSEMIPKILFDEKFFEQLLFHFSITVTEMFRDPSFYKYLRDDIIPYLKTYPFMKIWCAGCATGEEVYSLAILLKEEKLYDRVTIFATDFNDKALQKAKDGIYPLNNIKNYTVNYQKAGGKSSLTEYFHAEYDSVIMKQELREKITFANHNLVIDGVFGEMHLIFCRNVLIYFNRNLQNKVLDLFYNSLIRNGFLCLGTKESLQFLEKADAFKATDNENNIYRKFF